MIFFRKPWYDRHRGPSFCTETIFPRDSVGAAPNLERTNGKADNTTKKKQERHMKQKQRWAIAAAAAVIAAFVMAGCQGISNDESYGISLDVERHTFEALYRGYVAGDTARVELTVRINNTGNRPTGGLGITLTGDYEAFVLPDYITSIGPGGYEVFRVRPALGLQVGTHSSTVRVGGSGIAERSFDISFEVKPRPEYGIRLDAIGLRTFPMRLHGYAQGDLSPLRVEIRNVGYQPSGTLAVTLSGENADSFTVLPPSIPSIVPGGSLAFNVQPDLGLAVGTYRARITVTGARVELRYFDVVFEVTENDEITASFTCEAFRTIVRHAIGIGPGSPIMLRDVLDIIYVNTYQLPITSLAGIEHFASLRMLNAMSTFTISEVDLSGNPQLIALGLSENRLTHLDLSGLHNLVELQVESNLLQSITFGYHPNLAHMIIAGNELTSVDLTGLPNLVALDLTGNPFTELDFSRTTYLSMLGIVNTPITSLDLSTLNSLTILGVVNNPLLTELVMPTDMRRLNAIQISDNPQLSGRLYLSGLPALERVIVTDMEHIDLSNSPNLWELTAFRSRMANTDGLRLEGTRIMYLTFSGSHFESFDAGRIPATVTVLNMINNGLLESVDVRNLVNLELLNLESTAVTALDVTQNAALRRLTAVNSRIGGHLDLSQNPHLWQLWVQDNYIESIDIRGTSLGQPHPPEVFWIADFPPVSVHNNNMYAPDNLSIHNERIYGLRDQYPRLISGFNMEFLPQRGSDVDAPPYLPEHPRLTVTVGEPFSFEFPVRTGEHVFWSFNWTHGDILRGLVFNHYGELAGTAVAADEGNWYVYIGVSHAPGHATHTRRFYIDVVLPGASGGGS